MEQHDIKEIIAILTDASASRDFEAVDDAVELLKEYLDDME